MSSTRPQQAITLRPGIGLIFGSGDFPVFLAKHLIARNERVVAVGFSQLNPERLSFIDERVVMKHIRLGKLIRTLKARNIRRILLVGGFHNLRVGVNELLDLVSLWTLYHIIKTRLKGDNSVLVKVSEAFKFMGIEVVGLDEVAPEILAEEGLQAGSLPRGVNVSSMARAMARLMDINRYDIGQAMVTKGDRIIALEAAEGTDAMLERCHTLHIENRVGMGNFPLILYKAPKPMQAKRDDLPVVGCETLERAAKAQVRGVVLASGNVAIVDKEAFLACAERLGLFVYGMNLDIVQGILQTGEIA